MPRISSFASKQVVWLLTLMVGGAALGSGYVLVRGHTGESAARAAGPRLEKWEDPVLNLGEGKPGEVLTGSFNLRNLGNQSLDFQIRAGCNCAQLRPQSGRIEPGEVQEIIAGVRLRSEGIRERVRLLIQTNDPETSQAEYVLEANCPAPFEVSPALVDFGSVSEGQSPNVILTVRDAHGAPLPSTAELRSSVSNPHVSVDPMKSEGLQRQLGIRLLPSAPRGHLQADVTLTLAGANSPMHVPVAAYVVGQVLTAPQTLVLSPNGGEAKFLVWRPDEKLLGSLRHLDLPRGIAVDELSAQTAIRRRFRVRNVGLVGTGGPHLIRLWFEKLAEEVVVNVFVDKPAGK